MLKRISAGGLVVGKNGKILVVNQKGTSWSLPKGHVDSGEDKISAAKREIYEEAGVKQENLELIKDLGSYERYKIGKDVTRDDKSELKTIHMYLFKTKQERLAPIDPGNPEARWVNKDGVSSLLTHKKDKEFFDKIKDEVF